MRSATTVKVRWQVPGFHQWAAAPQAVEYLSTSHRHLFHFQVEAGVVMTDREVEFHQLLGKGQECLFRLFKEEEGAYKFENNSCESIAWALLTEMKLEVESVVAVEVWEDGECGARVEVERLVKTVRSLRKPGMASLGLDGPAS